MKTLIIGLGHRSGVGKDTSAKFLDTHFRCKRPGVKIQKISFADKLKDITFQLFEWTGIKRPIHYENNRKDRELIIPALGMTIVDLWVLVGEKLREVYPNVWLHYITEREHNRDIIIVPDLRHQNEANAIKAKGGKVFKVVNPRVPERTGRSIDDFLSNYDRWDGIILNDSSLEDLNSTLSLISDQLIEEYTIGK